MDPLSLETLIRGGETQTVEFKVAPSRAADLAERLCGLANGLGGYMILGVADSSWEMVGLKQPQEAIDRLLQAARLCKPTVPFSPSRPITLSLQEQTLVVAFVPPNDGTLYQAGGVCWVRRGTHTVSMDVSEIEQWLYHRGTLAWETRPVEKATLNDLDMRLVDLFLAQRPGRGQQNGRLANQEEILEKLGCIAVLQDEGQAIRRPTNVGLLLFGTDPQNFLLQAEVVCVLFRDPLGVQRYTDRRILQGTLPQQIDQAEAFFNQYMAVAARMEGFHRIDEPEYPIEALREAVVNALVHRDYSLQGEAVRIFYYPDRIEIRNPGVLLPGLNLEDLRQGHARSKPRNPVLAMMLRDMPGGYMERVGTGVRFMIDQMRAAGHPDPEFREQGEFIVIFLKQEAHQVTAPASTTQQHVATPSPTEPVPALAEREHRFALVLSQLHEQGAITNKGYRDLTGVSETTALRDLEVLVAQGRLRAIGQKRARKYVL